MPSRAISRKKKYSFTRSRMSSNEKQPTIGVRKW